MRVLGIETSCDDTGVAIYDSEQGLRAHSLYSQISHIKYGGVVPELASRDHIRKIIPLIEQTLKDAALTLPDLQGIAYTAGPGLIGALLVGASLGRSLAFGLSIPAIGVHHLEAHLLAPMLEDTHPTFPFLTLLVSGGHTLVVKVQDLGDYEILGESVDDAAGEAFDKTAKLLGLAYPGGAALAKLAERGIPGRFHFPRPMIDRPNLNFSFSGLKTAVAEVVKIFNLDEQTKADIAQAFQQAVIDTLVIKCKRALDKTGLNRLVVAGGVAANHLLRTTLRAQVEQQGGCVFYPRPEFCTDNGAMVAYAGCQRLRAGQHAPLDIQVRARWPLSELT